MAEPTRDPLRLALQIGVYVFLFFATVFVLGPLLTWAGDYLFGVTVSSLVAACFANWLGLRIYEGLPLFAAGLGWNADARRNLLIGVAGGVGAAALVLGPPLLFGAASIKPAAEGGGGAGTFAFVAVLLACGAAGEEILFRGYGFQLLLRAAGPYATILPVGILFAALHAGNPSASWLGLANTAGFGILFGWAFLRSQDLWLPIGLHYGWNFTLPVFGVNVSGIRMSMTGHVMEWSAGPVWSGGAYGPEASVLTSVVLAALFVGLWKSPIRRQKNLLLDPPKED